MQNLLLTPYWCNKLNNLLFSNLQIHIVSKIGSFLLHGYVIVMILFWLGKLWCAKKNKKKRKKVLYNANKNDGK